MRTLTRGLMAALLFAATTAAHGQSMDHEHMDHEHMDHGAAKQEQPASDTPATAAYRKADAAMHADMNRTFSGDADLFDYVLFSCSYHFR